MNTFIHFNSEYKYILYGVKQIKNKLIVKGNKIQCALYLDIETFKKIEKARGIIKRSTFIENIVIHSVEQKCAC